MRQLYDNHNHCQFSFDGGRTTVEKTARAAHRNGLSGLCFTDHMDYALPASPAASVPMGYSELFDVQLQQAEIDRVQLLLASEHCPVKIFKGVELGMEKTVHEQIRATVQQNSFDQIIASVHYLDSVDPFNGDYYEGKDFRQAYGHYLETILTELTWLEDFDIMGHYDYIARYAPYKEETVYYKDFQDIFDELLKYLAHNGKTLEINTKTYKDYKGRRPQLDLDVLKRFKEFGGDFISLGSDSHDAEVTGYNFDHFADVSLSCGIRYEVHFEGRKPVCTKL